MATALQRRQAAQFMRQVSIVERRSMLPIARAISAHAAAIRREFARVPDIDDAVRNVRQRGGQILGDAVFAGQREAAKIGVQHARRTVLGDDKSFMAYMDQKVTTEEILSILDQTFLFRQALLISNVTRTTEESVLLQVRQAIQAGGSARDIAAGVLAGAAASPTRDLDNSNFSVRRAFLIARTELASAANTAADEMASSLYDVSGERTATKEWSANSDSRTRDGHRRIDGTKIPTTALFSVNGDQMKHPGDRVGGSAKNVIRCRCSALYSTL